MAKDDIVDADAAGKASSDTFMTGVVIFTTIALIVAWMLFEKANGANYGAGHFFKP